MLALLLLASFVASIPAYYRLLQTVCTPSTAQCAPWQPTPGNIIALQRLHLPAAAYAAYFVSLYRYVRTYDVVQRQQVGWALVVVLVAVATMPSGLLSKNLSV